DGLERTADLRRGVGLGVEGFVLRRAAGKEEEEQVLRLAEGAVEPVRRTALRLLAEQPGQRQPAGAEPADAQHVAGADPGGPADGFLNAKHGSPPVRAISSLMLPPAPRDRSRFFGRERIGCATGGQGRNRRAEGSGSGREAPRSG